MKLLLFLTLGRSLEDWDKNKILNREIYPYIELAKKNIFTKIFSYGNNLQETKFNLKNIEVFTLNKYQSVNSQIFNLIKVCILILFNPKLFKCDIIKTNQVWGASAAVFLKFMINKPLVVRAGWEPFFQSSKYSLNYFKILIFYFNSYIAYKYSDHIIVSSKHIKDFICDKFNIRDNKITVINNYIDRNLFYIKKKFSSRISKRILFVGRLNKQKNLNELILAISKTNYGLDIIGEGEEENKLKKLVFKKNINVKFLGSIENSAIGKYYNKYKLFILPSHVEGNPKVLLEAMSCGCAIICSDVDGNNSIIKHKFNGFLINTNSEAISKGINEIMTNDNLLNKLIENSTKYIEDYCNLEKNLLIEQKIYKSLLNAK